MEKIYLDGITVEELKRIIEDSLIEWSPRFIEKDEPTYLSRKETADLLKITLPTLHKWTKKGSIRSTRIESRVLYLKSEVIELLTKKAQS